MKGKVINVKVNATLTLNVKTTPECFDDVVEDAINSGDYEIANWDIYDYEVQDDYDWEDLKREYREGERDEN